MFSAHSVPDSTEPVSVFLPRCARRTKIPPLGSRIMTCVEHLKIDLSLPLSYSIICCCCCCCCQCCKGKECGVTRVTKFIHSRTVVPYGTLVVTNRNLNWILKSFVLVLTCSSVIFIVIENPQPQVLKITWYVQYVAAHMWNVRDACTVSRGENTNTNC